MAKNYLAQSNPSFLSTDLEENVEKSEFELISRVFYPTGPSKVDFCRSKTTQLGKAKTLSGLNSSKHLKSFNRNPGGLPLNNQVLRGSNLDTFETVITHGDELKDSIRIPELKFKNGMGSYKSCNETEANSNSPQNGASHVSGTVLNSNLGSIVEFDAKF